MFLNQKSSDHPQSTPASTRLLPLRYSTRFDDGEEEKKKELKCFHCANSNRERATSQKTQQEQEQQKQQAAVENFAQGNPPTPPSPLPSYFQDLQQHLVFLEFKCCNARAWQAKLCTSSAPICCNFEQRSTCHSINACLLAERERGGGSCRTVDREHKCTRRRWHMCLVSDQNY